MARLSRRFQLYHLCHWPGPRSLATTSGVSFDILSYGYLDVSVPRVRLLSLCIQDKISFVDHCKSETGKRVSGLAVTVIKDGFPHSEIAGSKLIRSSPTLIAAYHVLHRLCMPRHPPDALKTLDHSHCRYPLQRMLPDNSFTGFQQSWKPGKTSFHENYPVAAVRLTNKMAAHGKCITAYRRTGIWIILLFTI